MGRFNVFIEDDVWARLKAKAALKKTTLREYLNTLLADAINTPKPKNEEPVKSPITWMEQEPNPMGLCDNCKYYHELKLVTYKDNDLAKVVGKLCTTCIRKAQSIERYVGEGDLING